MGGKLFTQVACCLCCVVFFIFMGLYGNLIISFYTAFFAAGK